MVSFSFTSASVIPDRRLSIGTVFGVASRCLSRAFSDCVLERDRPSPGRMTAVREVDTCSGSLVVKKLAFLTMWVEHLSVQRSLLEIPESVTR